MYAFFHATECPSGWTLADGQNGTLDMRGNFIRGVGGNSAALGATQGDAIRNITGHASWEKIGYPERYNIAGALSAKHMPGNRNAESGGSAGYGSSVGVVFDASKVVPTANENRPVNIALLACKSN